MSKKNHNKFSTKPEENVIEEVNDEIIETVVEEAVEEPVDEIVETIDELVEEVEVAPDIEPVYVITGCNKLNLRKRPSATAEVVYVINDSDEITIISDDGDWVEVIVNDKHGYCMKKFIVIK